MSIDVLHMMLTSQLAFLFRGYIYCTTIIAVNTIVAQEYVALTIYTPVQYYCILLYTTVQLVLLYNTTVFYCTELLQYAISHL